MEGGGEARARLGEWDCGRRSGGQAQGQGRAGRRAAGRALLGSCGVWDGVRPCFTIKKTAAPGSPRPCVWGPWQIGMGATTRGVEGLRPAVALATWLFFCVAAARKSVVSLPSRPVPSRPAVPASQGRRTRAKPRWRGSLSLSLPA